MSWEFGAFLATVGIISLSGVLMPGPVLVAAITKGSENKNAGIWIALGHLAVELPLILLIAAGFHYIFTDPWIKGGIGLIGGALLIFMGIQMFTMKEEKDVAAKAIPGHPIWAGIVTSASNPYFIFWWATIGATLINESLVWGAGGLVAFIIVHESCDLGWDYFVSYSTYKSKGKWATGHHKIIFGICGAMLIFFGGYFMLAAL